MKDSPTPPALAPVVPLIKRGDLDHYRHLARTADDYTLRVLVFVMVRDLEELGCNVDAAELGARQGAQDGG